MDKKKRTLQSVSDAITAKPISFNVKYKEKQSVEIKVIQKEPLHRYLPFLYKSIESITTEEKQVEKKQEFKIYPPTVGKMQVLSKLYLQLDFDETALQEEPHKEAMRVCSKHTDLICKLMAVSTCVSKEELLDDTSIDERAEFFKWHCTPDDFSICLLAMLTQLDYVNFMISMRLMKMFEQNKPTEKGASRIE